MNKILLAGVISAAFTSTAYADTILGVAGGIGRWQSELSGYVGDRGSPITSMENLGFKKEPSNYYWASLEHPIPLLPNIRLEYAAIEADATSNNTQEFQLGGVNVTVNIALQTQLELSYYDATLYYELLDNWLKLDWGLTIRKFDGSVYVESEFGRAIGTLDDTIPMGYLSTGLQIPGTNLSLDGRLQAVSYDGEKMVDYTISAGYYLDVMPMVDLGVNVGFRSLGIDAKEFGTLYADIKAEGPFAEIYVHF